MTSFHFAVIVLYIISVSNCSLFYEITGKRSKCYKEFILQDYVMVIKWKIFSLQPSTTQENLTNALKNIQINVYDDETNELVFQHSPKELKDKTSFNSKKNGQVHICTSVTPAYQKTIKDIYINIKLYSALSEPRINEAIKSQEINKIEREVFHLIGLIYPMIEKQKEELKIENQSAKETIDNVKWYKRLTFIQIFICVLVGVIQVFNFRRFLKSTLLI